MCIYFRFTKELVVIHTEVQVIINVGNIEFVSYKDGVVTVDMQGACSGCPSSTITLKQGVEQMLKSMIPQVKEVVMDDGLLMGPVY